MRIIKGESKEVRRQEEGRLAGIWGRGYNDEGEGGRKRGESLWQDVPG